MRLAVVDLGSNSFHLAVVDVDSVDSFIPVTRYKEMLGLGAVVARHGLIPMAEGDRAAQTFRRLVALARHAGADTILACATAAIRQATNGPQLIAAMAAESGVDIQILSGDDEARLIFGAVVASIRVDEDPVVCLDVGGGSLEVAVGGSHGAPYLASIDAGAARLSATHILNDPPRPVEIEAVRARVDQALEPVVAASSSIQPTMAVGTGGVVRDLARLVASRRSGSVGSINQLRISIEELGNLAAELATMTTAERARLPGIERARAKVAPVGAAMLVTAMDAFGVSELTIARWGLREGLILEHLGLILGDANGSKSQPDPRSASVEHMVRRFSTSPGRNERLAAMADHLFVVTAPVHGLGAEDRRLLGFGGLLADVGRHVSTRSSHKHGAYLVEHGSLRGFDPEEVAILATLVRYHRGGEPSATSAGLVELSPDRRRRTLALCALLRLSHHLVQCHLDAATVHIALAGNRRTVEVRDLGHPDNRLVSTAGHDLFEKVFAWNVEFAPSAPPAVLTL